MTITPAGAGPSVAPEESLAARIERASNDPDLCRALLARLERALAGRSLRFMEVCGTHTVSIFQSGLRSLLPSNVVHLSGPGCPVCVTHESEVALFLDLANRQDTILATFGDLVRVPGADGKSLKSARAAGARIEVVYSPLDAVSLARANPQQKVVFAGIGFETTAPAVAAAILTARAQGIANFLVLSLHKLIAPALRHLLADPEFKPDAFLLPGHVATITGLAPFAFISADFHKPAVVAGFEPVDILLALCLLAENESTPVVVNAYKRAVDDSGNARALALLTQVFEPAPARWRGFGEIRASGLAIRPEYVEFDAMAVFGLALPASSPSPGCRCGQILKGALAPRDCPLFAKKCTPANPVGPCMVSTEGSCAAWYKYGGLEC